MSHAITVPRLGWSMEEGTFGEWLCRDGEEIERGQPLFVLEGEKSAQDIESLEGGILRIPPDAPRPGDIVKVGQVLAYLVAAGEPAPFEQTAAAGANQSSEESLAATSPPPAGPAARRLARDLNVDLQSVSGSGRGGKVTLDDIHSAARPTAAASTGSSESVKVTASPRARRLAEQLSVDLRGAQGTGRTGRIRERDVRAAAEQQKSSGSKGAPVAATVQGTSKLPSSGEWHQPTSIRRTIASRMVAGVTEAAPVTLTVRCDATNLVNLRQQFRAAATDAESVPSYNDLFVRLSALAIARHPEITIQWHSQGLFRPEGVHIAVAVDTEGGLVAPVVRDADRLPLRELTSQLRSLVALARQGGLAAEQMQGGVFTITNLGMFGVDSFTPILNLPQSAILGIGRIVREPAVVGELIVPRDQLALSLTFDHRVIDGAPAARFLDTLRQAVEQPAAWLVS